MTESNHTRELGQTGVNIPVIGFGTWRYTGGITPLRAAIDHGAKFFDTAETYGTEQVVGEAIRECRPEVFVATKARPKNFRKRDLIRAAEGSLRRLGTDYIDLYQLHWPNYTIPIEETMAGMEELVESGKIRYIGVSNFSAQELVSAQRALRRHRIVSNQVRYSLIDRTIENGLLKFCAENQITVIAFSPLGLDYSSLRAHDPERVLTQLAQKYGKTEAQVALNWVIKNSRTVAIPKASTVNHVIEDCGAIGWELSDMDYAVLRNKIRCHRRSAIERLARRWVKRVVQFSGRAT